MSHDDVIRTAREGFVKRFGTDPEAVAYAPGRVNLLGEHTDYNGGLVLPMPLALGTAAALGKTDTPGLHAASDAFENIDKRDWTEPAKDVWSDYVLGSLMAALEHEIPAHGIEVMIATDLPVGSGLSSSAAIEIATMRGASELLDRAIDPVEMAIRARAVENNFVGLPSGIMDQFSVSVGTRGQAVFLDTRTLSYEPVPLPATHNFVIVHSGVGHQLSDSGYRERVRECSAACEALDVEMLSDLNAEDMSKINALEPPLEGRARHIVTENARVKAAISALKTGDVATFATLMNESHASQRDDYAVSTGKVDALVNGALEAGADGARLTGGGFGGSIVALVEKGRVTDWCETISDRFPKTRILAVT